MKCYKEYYKQWYLRNRERIKALALIRKQRDPVKWRAQQKKRSDKYRKVHMEKLLERGKQYRLSNREKVSRSQAEWCSRNKHKRAASSRRFRRNHPGYYTQYWKDYRIKNREYVASLNLKHKIIRRGACIGDSAVGPLIAQWRREPRFECSYCRNEFSTREHLQVDHIIPISRGGKHTVDNVCRACKRCNLSKNSKTPEEFLCA